MRELDERAARWPPASSRPPQPGERALLIYPAGLDFLVGFFGCLYAGLIGIPTPPPEASRLKRTKPRLQSIADDAKASLVLTTSRDPGAASSSPSPSIFGTAAAAVAHHRRHRSRRGRRLAPAPDMPATTWRTCSTRPAPRRSPRE